MSYEKLTFEVYCREAFGSRYPNAVNSYLVLDRECEYPQQEPKHHSTNDVHVHYDVRVARQEKDLRTRSWEFSMSMDLM